MTRLGARAFEISPEVCHMTAGGETGAGWGRFRRVCVFCGSNRGRRPEYAALAAGMGTALVQRGWGLVYGGGSVGMMGVLADAVLAAGGEVTGVIPEMLATRELLHPTVTTMHVVPSMHARKALMADLSDAFIALPGGYGTFEEVLEVITWAQLGIHRKPIGVLDALGYFSPLLELIDHGIAEGFIRPEQRALLVTATEPAELLDRLAGHEMPFLKKWIEPEAT